jgi:PhoPQ-activated pathogenicity-related protein
VRSGKTVILAFDPEGMYRLNISAPPRGWKGYFVELTYPGKIPLKVTTGITILPKVYPFDPYLSEDPKGTQLVP